MQVCSAALGPEGFPHLPGEMGLAPTDFEGLPQSVAPLQQLTAMFIRGLPCTPWS